MCTGGGAATHLPLKSESRSKLREISVLKTGRQSVIMETLGDLLKSLQSRILRGTRRASSVQFLTHFETTTPPLLFLHQGLCSGCLPAFLLRASTTHLGHRSSSRHSQRRNAGHLARAHNPDTAHPSYHPTPSAMTKNIQPS